MAINNNLYPPIIETFNPAFLINGRYTKCRIYFSISLYNSFSDIANAQIAISYQNNNKSALYSQRRNTNDLNEKPKYPCDIMLTNIHIDNDRLSDDKYYIEINNDDLQNGFEINQYYKVQIRFTGIGASEVSLDTPQAIDSWLSSNLSLFSEWSSICLVRGIAVPRLEITGLEAAAESTLWTNADSRIVGELTFADEEETETLKSYRIKLYNANTDELISDSDLQYTSAYTNVNQFVYTFPYELLDGNEYFLTVEYTTMNLYSQTDEYTFTVIQSSGKKLNATITAEADDEEGGVHIHLQGKTVGEIFTGNITIRRTSSLSNFQLWEDVYTTTLDEGKELNLDWYDFTIESGIWYLYCAQRRDSLGNRGVVLKINNPVMVDLEFFYLSAEGKQLKLKFDHNISSFKHQIFESKVDTLGSKYPFIKRNGAVDYRTFQLSGKISHFMDDNHIFSSREEIFGDSIELYDKYNWDHRITEYNDYTHERKFRELVIDFLYKHNVKLFRSATEGNILVKLMDINFTPEQVLGGYIYNFSCTAYEIDECTQTNIDYYNIQPIGKYSEILQYVKDYFGQSMQVFPANKDVLTILQNEYQQYAEDKYIAKIEYLDSLRLEFTSKPYLIGEGAAGPYPIRDTGTVDANILASAYLGYIAYINGKPIVINPEGIYELRQPNVQVTSLYFPVNTEVTIDYHLELSQTEDLSQLYKSTNYFTRVGQYWGSFGYKDSIYQQIFNKYYEKYTNYMQSLISLNKIKVEAEPGTVVYTKEAQDDNFERHVIGPTCTLDFSDDESLIEGVYFAGVHLEPATAAEQERDNIPDNKYIDTGETIYTLDGFENPIKNGVYTLSDLAIDSIGQTEPDKIWVEEEEIEPTGTLLKSNVLGLDITGKDEQRNQVSVDENNYEKTGNQLFTLVLDKNGGLVPVAFEEPRNQLVVQSEDTSSEIIDPYYRLILHRAWDKEFALFIEEIINETNKYIWYNNQWWVFTDNADLICPVEGLIDYYCEIMKGNYAI